MTARAVAAVELLIAIGLAYGAWACWQHGVRTTAFTASGGVPGFSSTSYAGGWIFGAALLVVLVATCLIDLARRLLLR